jgi:hypothetical protein
MKRYWCPPTENEWALLLTVKVIGFAATLLAVTALSIR